MAKTHFRVVGRLDHAAKVQTATVTIHRGTGIFSVRPLRRHRTYDLPLDTVAEMVVARVIRAEDFTKRLEKAKRKKG